MFKHILNRFTCSEKQLPIIINRLRNNRIYPILDHINENGNDHFQNYKINKQNIIKYPNNHMALKLSSLNIENDYNLSKQEEQELLIKAQSEGVELSVWRQSKKYNHDNPNHLCPWVFTRPYISCDLRTVPCSMIGNPDVSEFGDATHLKDTWNSKNYINFRRSHLQGNVPDMCKLCYV